MVDTDRYKRRVAKIYIDGKYVNQMILAEGLAWWYKRYAPKDVDLKEAENSARVAKKGLWSQPHPTPPWEFRKNRAPASKQ